MYDELKKWLREEAGKKMANRLVEYEQKEITIMNLTGYTLDHLIQLFAAGYILIPPVPTKDLSSVFSMHLNEREQI